MKKKLAVALAAATVAVSGSVIGSTVSASTSASTATPIGYQHGIEAARLRMKKLDPAGFNATGTGAWDKFFRTVRILVDDHDAGIVVAPPPPTTTTTAPPPPPPPPVVAPQTFNAEGGSNAKYCTTGLSRNAEGRLHDAYATYDDNGLQLGGRTEKYVPGLRGSRTMDGYGPCDLYPPLTAWPAASYER